MAKIYSIASDKGGTGKTTSVINLAAALSALGKDVLVVDANLSTPNIGLHLGAPIVPVTLNHVLSDRADLSDAIYKHESGIKVLPSSLSIGELKKIKYEKLPALGEQLKEMSDCILLDSSAGLGKELESSLEMADGIILVTQAEMPSVTDALKTAKLAEQMGKKVTGFIITRYRGKKTEMPIENILDMLELPLLGIVPEDKNMQKALFLKNPIVLTHPRSKASKAYNNIARRFLGMEEKKEGFFSRIFR